MGCLRIPVYARAGRVNLILNQEKGDVDKITNLDPENIITTVRIWGEIEREIVLRKGEDYIKLENGIEVKFDSADQSYRTGDYWLIPTRSQENIGWTEEPDGIDYHYCPLAIVTYNIAIRNDM